MHIEETETLNSFRCVRTAECFLARWPLPSVSECACERLNVWPLFKVLRPDKCSIKVHCPFTAGRGNCWRTDAKVGNDGFDSHVSLYRRKLFKSRRRGVCCTGQTSGERDASGQDVSFILMLLRRTFHLQLKHFSACDLDIAPIANRIIFQLNTSHVHTNALDTSNKNRWFCDYFHNLPNKTIKRASGWADYWLRRAFKYSFQAVLQISFTPWSPN